jgi:hypothetical protein
MYRIDLPRSAPHDWQRRPGSSTVDGKYQRIIEISAAAKVIGHRKVVFNGMEKYDAYIPTGLTYFLEASALCPP